METRISVLVFTVLLCSGLFSNGCSGPGLAGRGAASGVNVGAGSSGETKGKEKTAYADQSPDPARPHEEKTPTGNDPAGASSAGDDPAGASSAGDDPAGEPDGEEQLDDLLEDEPPQGNKTAGPQYRDALKAKAALLALMKIKPSLFDPVRADVFENLEMTPAGSGIFRWGGFEIDIAKKVYRVTILRPGEAWVYTGRFEVDETGRWRAKTSGRYDPSLGKTDDDLMKR